MRTPVRVVVGLAAVAVGLAGCTGSGPEPAPRPGPDSGPGGGVVGLVAFDSCATARQELVRAALPYVGPYGLLGPMSTGARPQVSAREDSAAAGGAAAPAAPPAHSTTTVHEAGVDEPDVVKTDGRRLVSVVDGRLRVVDLASRAVTTIAGLPGGPSTRLLLHGDRALVVVGDGAVGRGPRPDVAPGPAAGVRFVLVDLAAGRVLDTLSVDGAFVDGRQVGGVARLVVRSGPRLRFVRPDDRRSADAARRENRRVVAGSAVDDWLPRYELDRGGVRAEGRLLDCARLSHPAAYTAGSMVTVLTVDLAGRLGTGDPVGVVADGEVVYGTATSLYVAAQEPPPPADQPVWGPAPLSRAVPQRIQVHKLDLPGAGRPRYAASGSVAGWLLNQYALSEHDGRLRVATTVDLGDGRDACCDGPPRTESAVTVLAQRGDRLVAVGRLGGLGKGERIHAVRFLGPVGYVVTFRQTDPLYTVDLSDPERPRAVGELKIPGYSAYLHPTGGTTLLGVGQEATGQGRTLGTQVSLFDVGDPARPRRTAQHHVADGHSEVEFDPHAFLWWPAARLAVVPVTAWRGGSGGSDGAGALVLRVGDGRLDEVGTVRHPAAGTPGYPGDGVIRRSLVVGDTLWTVSGSGARAVAVADLADRGWVPFS